MERSWHDTYVQCGGSFNYLYNQTQLPPRRQQCKRGFLHGIPRSVNRIHIRCGLSGMKYSSVVKGVFIDRPNRFVARVRLIGPDDQVSDPVIVSHVKNTGRCRELLVPGAEAYLSVSDNPSRSTKYDLIVVQKGSRLINMNSQIPNVWRRRISAGSRSSPRWKR